MGAQNQRQPREGRRQPRNEETPTTMVLLAVMIGVMGLISLIAGLGVSFLGGLIAGVGDAGSDLATTAEGQQTAQQVENTGNLVMILGLVQIVTAVIKFVGVYGVFKARSWAFYLLGGTFAFDVLQNVAGFAGIFSWSGGVGIFGILVFVANAAILGFLLMNQDYFGVDLFGGSSQPARA